jgi:hypothetical protein
MICMVLIMSRSLLPNSAAFLEAQRRIIHPGLCDLDSHIQPHRCSESLSATDHLTANLSSEHSQLSEQSPLSDHSP